MKNTNKPLKRNVEEDPKQLESPQHKKLRIFCLFKKTQSDRYSLTTPHLEVEGKIVEGRRFSFKTDTPRDQCMSKFFNMDDKVPLKVFSRIRIDEHVPLTADQIMTMHDMTKVTPLELKEFYDTCDSFKDFSEKVETRAIIRVFAR